MKNLMTLQKQKKLSLISIVLLLVLVVALMVIITTPANAAQDNIVDSLSNTRSTILQNEKLLFNPFTLQRESQDYLKSYDDDDDDIEGRVDNILRRIQQRIRFPQRPTVRSVFKPDRW